MFYLNLSEIEFKAGEGGLHITKVKRESLSSRNASVAGAAVPDYRTKIEEVIQLFGEGRIGFIRNVMGEGFQKAAGQNRQLSLQQLQQQV